MKTTNQKHNVQDCIYYLFKDIRRYAAKDTADGEIMLKTSYRIFVDMFRWYLKRRFKPKP